MNEIDSGTWLQIASLVALAVVVLLAMRAGWHRRGRDTAAAVPQPHPAPAADDPSLGAERTAPVAATYVSTTFAHDLLERVVAHGLGTRSAAVVHVHDGGVVVRRQGAADLYVPTADLDGTSTAAGMAGKHVGGQGLVVVRWRAGTGPDAVVLATGLRLAHRADTARLRDAIDGLGPQQSTTQEENR